MDEIRSVSYYKLLQYLLGVSDMNIICDLVVFLHSRNVNISNIRYNAPGGRVLQIRLELYSLLRRFFSKLY